MRRHLTTWLLAIAFVAGMLGMQAMDGPSEDQVATYRAMTVRDLGREARAQMEARQ